MSLIALAMGFADSGRCSALLHDCSHEAAIELCCGHDRGFEVHCSRSIRRLFIGMPTQNNLESSMEACRHNPTGWITTFCFWNSEGGLLYREPSPEAASDRRTGYNSCRSNKNISFEQEHPGEKDRQKDWNDLKNPYLALDGAAYHWIGMTGVPSGYGSVPADFKDDLGEFEATMIVGSVGIKSTSSGKPLHHGQTGFDTERPVSGWRMFEKKVWH